MFHIKIYGRIIMNASFSILVADSPSPGAIIGIVIFLVLVIVLPLMSVKSAGKGGAKKIKELYGDKIIDEGQFMGSMHYFFTADEFIVQKYNAVFATYRLQDIRKIALMWDPTQRLYVLLLADADQAGVKPAEIIGGTKAAQKMFGKNYAAMKENDGKDIIAKLLKYAPHIQLMEKKK